MAEEPTTPRRVPFDLPPVAAETKQTCHVLAVGINKFKNKSSFLDLRGPVKDAEAVAELFRGQGPGVTVTTLLNEAATGGAISKALNDLHEKSKPGDRVIVFLSSHGVRTGKSFQFVAHDHDAVATHWADKEVINRSSLGMLLFSISIDRLAQGREVILIIDACHAGQVLTDVASTLNRKSDGGLVVLASSAPGQTSIDGPDNGRFTQAVLEAFRGHADADGNGEISLKEIRRYLSGRMKTLEANPNRWPGMPLVEQDYVSDASYSVPETLVLSRPKGKVSPIEPVKWLPAPEPMLADAAGATPGTWRNTRILKDLHGETVVRWDGKPLPPQTFDLEFRPDGGYSAISRGPLGEKVGTGKWKKSEGKPNDIELMFGGGVDKVRVEEVTADSLQVRVYLHGSMNQRFSFDKKLLDNALLRTTYNLEFDSRHPPVSYIFERVKEMFQG